MSTLTADTPTADAAPTDAEALAEHLFGAAIATVELATIHLGRRLGLYEALGQHGPATAAQLAERAGIDERYARERLEQQGVAQLLVCPNPGASARERIYELPTATAETLFDTSSPAFLGPLAHLAVGTMLALPELEDAFRTGEGVPFHRYGDEVRHGLGSLNGASFDRELAGWIANRPDIQQRLREGAHPRVLDLGCGIGRSSIAAARAFPRAEVRGVDLDQRSVAVARQKAAEAGFADRVRFEVGDASGVAPEHAGTYGLVLILEALHDMGDPVGALRAARAALVDGGAVLVADQLTRDAYLPDGDPIERFQYGCSVLHCLPATRAEEHVVAHGTVIRASTVETWARKAGFDSIQVLDIEDPFWRFYRL